MRLFLIRHGQTLSNATGRFQGQLQVPLSDRGRAQAAKLQARLSGMRFDAVVSSDLERASETATIAFGADGYSLDSRLRERGLGAIEGLTRPEVAERFPDFLQSWKTDPSRVQAPGIEPFDVMQQRLRDALGELPQRYDDGATVVWVSHGFAIRAMMHEVLEMPIAALGRVAIENTSITELHLRPARGFLAWRINDHAHLE